MDWSGGRAQDKANLVSLVTELRAAFVAEAVQTGKARLLLSLAVPAGAWSISLG